MGIYDITERARAAGWQAWATVLAAIVGVLMLVAGQPLTGFGVVLVLAAVAAVLAAIVRRVTRG